MKYDSIHSFTMVFSPYTFFHRFSNHFSSLPHIFSLSLSVYLSLSLSSSLPFSSSVPSDNSLIPISEISTYVGVGPALEHERYTSCHTPKEERSPFLSNYLLSAGCQ